jgi:hypothetical protein
MPVCVSCRWRSGGCRMTWPSLTPSLWAPLARSDSPLTLPLNTPTDLSALLTSGPCHLCFMCLYRTRVCRVVERAGSEARYGVCGWAVCRCSRTSYESSSRTTVYRLQERTLRAVSEGRHIEACDCVPGGSGLGGRLLLVSIIYVKTNA